MKNIDEIKSTPGISIDSECEDGMMGKVFSIEYKNGKVKIINKENMVLTFIFSFGGGWEHLSVSTPNRTPSWKEMQKMKEIFWNDDEVCMQLHPKKEDYVDNMKYCLHIWRPIDKEIPTPPSVMVGFRKGKEEEDLMQLLNMYDEMLK